MKKIILSILIAIMIPSLSLRASDINQQLYDSAYELNVDKVQALLNSGADPNWLKVSNRKSTSILKWASYKASDGKQAQKNLLEIATILFEKGAKLGPHDKDILYFPIAYGAHDLTQLFIKHGASPIKFPRDVGSDITPVELAAQHGHTDIQKVLVQHGAVQLDTKTVIQLQFVGKASSGTVPELEDLIKKGARVNTKNRLGDTALINCLSFPVFSSSAPIFFYLLDIGADVNLKGHYRYWKTFPLHVAISNTSYTLNSGKAKPGAKKISKKILNSLIKAGAYVSSRDELGQTPLHVAAKYNNIYAAQLLLNHHAKVMPRDGEGNTPLDYAESGDMIKILKDHGAKEL